MNPLLVTIACTIASVVLKAVLDEFFKNQPEASKQKHRNKKKSK